MVCVDIYIIAKLRGLYFTNSIVYALDFLVTASTTELPMDPYSWPDHPGTHPFPGTTSRQLKISNRDFSKTAGLTPIFEAKIVIYDQLWV